MSTLVYFKRPILDPLLDLEVLKVRCWRSWFNTQTIPTEIVEALIERIESLQASLASEYCLTNMYSEEYTAVRQKLHDIGAIADHEEITCLDAIERMHTERVAVQNEKRVLACVYCGKEYPPGTYPEVLTEHIKSCPKHPLAKVLTELAQAEDYIQYLEVRWDTMRTERNTCIAKAEVLLANIRKAIDWLWGFWDGNTLLARPGFEDDIKDAWIKLLMSVD